jgi:hypothetical protein
MQISFCGPMFTVGNTCRDSIALSPPRTLYLLLLCLLTINVAVALFFPSKAAAQIGDQPLFDGKTLLGWTTLDGKPVNDGWEVVNGSIHRKLSERRVGPIVTEREFGDMDLSFEWKIAPGGNNGLKYRVRKYDDRILGCEYQIIDDAKYRKQLSPKTSAGALYDLFEPNRDKHLKPADEFNSARVVVHGNNVQHWLNGRLIVSATIGSEEWTSRVAHSKFSDIKDFARCPRGKLMLTDHGDEVWYRDLRLLPIRQTVDSPNATPRATSHKP